MKRNVRLLALLACLLITALVFAVPAFAVIDAADEVVGDVGDVTNGVANGEEATAAIDISFNITRFVDSLQYMWKGMLCIFIVIGVIILLTYMLNRFVNYVAFKNDNK